MGGVGAEGGLGREEERVVVEVGEFEVRAAGEDGFGDIGLGDLDAQIVVDGPETCIEEIVGGRGQGEAVFGAVRASLGVGVDVGGLQGHVGRLGGDQPVAGQGAGEVVARDDRDLETGVPTPVKLGFIGRLVLADRGQLIGRRFPHA